MIIPFQVIPQIVVIAIVARKFPLTAIGGSIVLANYNIPMNIIGLLFILAGQISGFIKWKAIQRRDAMIKELEDKINKDLESQKL